MNNPRVTNIQKAQLTRQVTIAERLITQLQTRNERIQNAIGAVLQDRREFVEQIKQRNAQAMKDYTEQIAPLQHLGLNLSRLPNESDEDYQNRILLGTQAITVNYKSGPK